MLNDGADVQLRFNDPFDETLRVKHNALRRCITNLVNNACACEIGMSPPPDDPDGTNVIIMIDTRHRHSGGKPRRCVPAILSS